MAEQYDDAALRHYEDAKLLAKSGRYDNAGHLIGFCAECAIKYVIESSRVDPQGTKVHLPDIANAARRRFHGRNPAHASMRSLLESTKASFFSDWSVSDRYSEDNLINKAQYERWEQLATRSLAAAGLRKKT